MALNIYISFDNKQYNHFQFVPEKFNWERLVTCLDISSQSAEKKSVVLYHLHPITGDIKSVSSQLELDALMVDLNTPNDDIYFNTNSKPEVPPVALSHFQKLTQLVFNNQPLGPYESRWVGILATKMVFSPEENFDKELDRLEKLFNKSNKKMDKLKYKEMRENESSSDASTSSSSESEDNERNYSSKGIHRGHYGGHRRGGRSNKYIDHFDKNAHYFGHFGKHSKHHGLFDKHVRRFGFPGKHGKHFGPFGKHNKYFGPFGKHNKHFGPFGKHFGPFGKHTRHSFGRPGGLYDFLGHSEQGPNFFGSFGKGRHGY